MTRNFLVLSGLMLLLSGCASDQKFSCPGPRSGVTCASAMEVYNAQIAGKSSVDAIGKNGDGKGVVIETVPDDVRYGSQPLSSPLPVLAPAQVLRIWVNGYVDAKGDLFYPGLIYSEITPRTWNSGERQLKRAPILTPFQVENSAPVDTKSATP